MGSPIIPIYNYTDGGVFMGRVLLILVLIGSLVGCGEKTNENDTEQLNAQLQNIAEAIITRKNVPHDTEYGLKYVRQRIGDSTLEDAVTPPALKRVNPSVHVDSLQVNALYKINGALFNTKWHFKRNEEGTEWILMGPTVRDIKGHDLVYNTEDVLIACLDNMSWDTFDALEPETGWESSDDLLLLLEKTFNALVENDMGSLMFLTAPGTLVRAGEEGTDINSLLSEYLPDREFDTEGSTEYLKEQIKHTADIMKYCQADVKEVLPYVQAYSIDSMPEYCIRVSLSITFTGPKKYQGITVGKRAMKGFIVDWTTARVHEKWFMDSLLINCLVTDMAKGLYKP